MKALNLVSGTSRRQLGVGANKDIVDMRANVEGRGNHINTRKNGPSFFFYGNDIPSLHKSVPNTPVMQSKDITEWKKGEIVRIVLDCKEWTISFWKVGLFMGRLDIEKNKTYYPQMGLNKDIGHDFILLADGEE